jgi:hypothetical protein
MLDTFQPPTPSRSGFVVRPAVEAKYNPFNGVETIVEEPGDKWHATLYWAFVRTGDLRYMRGFLNKHINYGKFYLRDTAHKNLGPWTGTTTVNGTNQDGKVLFVNSPITNGLVGAICDRFTLDGHIYELTEDAYTDANGNALLRFTPELRTIPADGAQLITVNPYGTFMLKNPNQIPDFSQNRLGKKGVTIEFIEALRP